MGWAPGFREAATGAKDLGASTDIIAIVVAVLPIIHRVVAILKDLQPEIKGWMKAQTERSGAEVNVAEEISELSASLKAHLAVIEELLRERNSKP